MNYLKVLISLFITLVVINHCSCQTLLEINTGPNWTILRDNQSTAANYSGTYKSYPSYYFSLLIKGRKAKPVHIGASISCYQSSINWQSIYGGHSEYGKNINYLYETLRFSIFPECSFGKTVQFFFDISPYLSVIINSTKKGKSWGNNGNYITNQDGSAESDLHKVDLGFQESAGIGYLVTHWLLLSVEENASIGILNINKATEGTVNAATISILFGISFIIPESSGQDPNKSDISNK